MRNKLALNLIIGCFLSVCAAFGYLASQGWIPAWTRGETLALEVCDHEVGRYVTVVDYHGSMITKTSRQVFPGDEIITSRAKHYRVTSVEHDVARAKLLGLDHGLLAWSEYFDDYYVDGTDEPVAPALDLRETDVAVYHTHTMESFLPDDGEAFEERGDIIDVGRVFATELRRQGLKVVHDTTCNNPHDAQAYERSRKTVVKLMREHNPSILLDIHRDGVPDPDFYRQEIAGETVSQLRLVVGRQNPKREANTDFARRLMARANEKHPDLVMEIFKASGNYNQDLTSTNVLIEAGTYTLTKDEAKGGLALFAETVPAILGMGPAAMPDQAGGAVGWRVTLGIVLAVLIGLGVYLVISAGGVPQAREKVTRFFTDELGVRFRGQLLKLKDKRDDRDKPEK